MKNSKKPLTMSDLKQLLIRTHPVTPFLARYQANKRVLDLVHKDPAEAFRILGYCDGVGLSIDQQPLLCTLVGSKSQEKHAYGTSRSFRDSDPEF